MIQKQLRFAGETFRDTWQDPEGDVFIRPLGGPFEKTFRLLCGLKVGTAYTPGMHNYQAVVEVVTGTGLFYLYDKTISYGPGSRFVVEPETAHSFIRVDQNTIFIKKVDTMWQRCLQR